MTISNYLSIHLVDAETDEILAPIDDGQIPDLSRYSGRDLSIAAYPRPDPLLDVGSVRIELNGDQLTENVSPYTLFGDESGDFYGGATFLSSGNILSLTAYSQPDGTGIELERVALEFDGSGNIAPDEDGGSPPAGGASIVLPPDSLAALSDRIVFHFDGNNNDPDDIAALPVAALLARDTGVAGKTTFLYGNNLTEPNDSVQLSNLEASGAFARSLGVDARNYQEAIAGTTAHLTELFSSGQKVLVLEGGPMEASYRALAHVDASNHKNITLVSHSSWNETRAETTRSGVDEARTWSDIGRDFPEVTRIEITDQNDGFRSAGWTWMDGSDLPDVQRARDLMEAAGGSKKDDASDSGMLYYALTGDQNGSPADAQALIGYETPPQEVNDVDGSNTLDFYIADAATDEVLSRIVQDASFDFDLLDGRDLTVIAVAEEDAPSPIGSVKVTLAGHTQIENVAPFALYGDLDGDLNGDGNLGPGQHKLEVIVFEQADGQGAKVDESTLDFLLV